MTLPDENREPESDDASAIASNSSPGATPPSRLSANEAYPLSATVRGARKLESLRPKAARAASLLSVPTVATT